MVSTNDEYIRRINLVLDYINSHLGEELDLDSLADVAMFSKYHFHRVFKALVGETLQEYIRRIRLEKAANLLAFSPRVSVLEIGLYCGYSSQSNFTKAFKKQFGVPPTEMRDYYQNSNSGIAESKLGEVPDPKSPHVASVDSTNSISDSSQTRAIPMDVKVETIPESQLAYVRNIGPYHPDSIGPAFQRLCQWAGPKGLLANNPLFIGISWDNPDLTPPEKCRYDAALVVPEETEVSGDVGATTLSPSLYAIYHCEVRNYAFAEAWERFYKEWLPSSGYQPNDRPCLERYYNDDVDRNSSVFILDLCMAVKPL